MSKSVKASSVRTLALLALVALLAVPPSPASVAAQDGATLTVLRGQVAVVHPNGSAVQPAPSGITVYSGDEIRTIDESGALITFFVGTEIEMGESTVLLVESVSREGEKIDISLKQVLGATVSRVQSFSNPGSSYRIEAGGAVALVRGSELSMAGPDCSAQGCFVTILCFDCEPELDTLQCGGSVLPLGPGNRGYRAQVDPVNGSVIGECVEVSLN